VKSENKKLMGNTINFTETIYQNVKAIEILHFVEFLEIKTGNIVLQIAPPKTTRWVRRCIG
jgi:hypothetical protein